MTAALRTGLLWLGGEWLRLRRDPVARAVLLALALLLAASALGAGGAARQLRQDDRQAAQQIGAARQAALDSAAATAPADPAAAQQAVRAAYALARGDLGSARLPPGAGLPLAVQAWRQQPTVQRASVELRALDGRAPGAALQSPLLAATGLPDFAAVCALLLPLALLALCAGAVQDERATGTWLQVRAQGTRTPAAVASIAVLLRGALVLAVAVAASALAFATGGDGGPGTSGALVAWCGALALYTAFWCAVCLALQRLPVSAGAATMAGLGLWLALCFAAPPLLAAVAERQAPMPSRLEAVVALRAARQRAEDDEAALLAAWYAAHPQHRPPPAVAPAAPGWPVTFVPRALTADAALRPLQRRFPAARAAQEDHLRRHAWLSPPLALLLQARRLAGADAARHAGYLAAVDAYEDRWRGFWVPRILGYRGLVRSDAGELPVFRAPS
ncbi:DUF3526 domain-containing protein [uncultured Xylophilus sp.]|uniref:DUF3526 domain-containing protein n=1 Tax=uncultured Xylophilus sp. TaxID=296832 RepID=UPI0025E64256|nr:DUF3526 domain-containing protein [uncultured Xylophilus sp.]